MKILFKLSIVIIVFSFISCKKEKLEGDTTILKGEWEWTHTQEVQQYCEVEALWMFSTLDTATASSTYSIKFEEEGKMTFYHNGGKINSNRIVFNTAATETYTSGPYDYKFTIWPNYKASDIMEVFVGPDSMRLYEFPKDSEYNCTEYFNHFVKK